MFFPCSPSDNFQIKLQEPEKTFFEVRSKLGSVSFMNAGLCFFNVLKISIQSVL